MAMAYVVTAGSGDTYRVERINLDGDEAYGFAQAYTASGERFDDFAVRQEWWTGEELPEATVVRRELAGVPRVEVVGLSREKVEEVFWDAITQSPAHLAGIERK